MESKSSSLTVSNASATGSGRTKVALKPGHSLMDWIRYTHSGKDLTSTGGRITEVTPRELAKHNTRQDAWIALKGKVYNITPYLDYHPGGEEELMRGAGKDATDLFNQVHKWVNAESMLQKCFVGILKKSWSLEGPKFPSVKPLKKMKHEKIIAKSISPVSFGIDKENGVKNGTQGESKATNGESNGTNGESNGTYEWYQISDSSKFDGELLIRLNDEGTKMIVNITSPIIQCKELITYLENEDLFTKLNKNSSKWLNIRFPSVPGDKYEVKIAKTNLENDTISLIFDCDRESCCNPPKFDPMWNISERGQSVFWPCKLVKKIAVNYNTYLFIFLLPPSVYMRVPVGCHVFVKSEIEGMEIVRSYTPIVPSLDNNKEDNLSGSHLALMIKIYPSGTLTPMLNLYNIGESLLISSYEGNFSEMLLKQSDSIVMLAAGTGITPMIGVIHWVLTAQDKKRSLLLLFFNKTEDDILWRAEFEKCSKDNENFQIIHILSNLDPKWSGYTGVISEDILKNLLPSKPVDNHLILICGPMPFTNSALRKMWLQTRKYPCFHRLKSREKFQLKEAIEPTLFLLSIFSSLTL